MTKKQINVIDPMLAKSRQLTPIAKLVLGRLGGLSSNWRKPCFASNSYIAQELGISVHAVSDAIKLLVSAKILSKSFKMVSHSKIRYLNYIYIESSENKSSENENSDNEISNIESSNNEEPSFSSCTTESSENEISSIYVGKNISNDISYEEQNTTSSTSSSTQFSIEKIENDALYLQNIFTEEIMKLAKRNVEARNVSSFIESEKWLRWNRENDKLKYIKSEKRLRELVSSWILRTLENSHVVTHSEVTNQEDLTEKRQAFLASLKY